MAKQVTFNPRVKVRAGSKDAPSVSLTDAVNRKKQEAQKLVNLGKSDMSGAVIGATIGMIIMVLILLAVFATWIAGLVKMGMCGGASSGYFWATLLLFLLLPGPGSLAGFIMAIVALAVLKPGKSALGMTCPAKKK